MNEINEKFGHRIRIRACALIFKDDSLLLVQHSYLGKNNNLWAPPGGGVDFGESVYNALVREVKEETGLEVVKAQFQFINEFINDPLHAVEHFFYVSHYTGQVKTGSDPELEKNQIIKNVKFVTFNELRIMNDNEKHNILHGNPSIEKLKTLSGYKCFHPFD